MNLVIDTLDSLWKVVAVGLLFGAGLPALFALGMRELSPRPLGVDADGKIRTVRPGTWRTVLGYGCFAAVIIAIVGGVAFIVLGGH